MSQIQLRIAPFLVHWNELREEIERFLVEQSLDSKARFTILLCCEEWFVNIVNHGFSQLENKQLEQAVIQLQIQMEKGQRPSISLTFIDGGIPFDPLAHTQPQLEQAVEERAIGGLGIFFIRTKMDHCQYEYKNGHNYFTMKKEL